MLGELEMSERLGQTKACMELYRDKRPGRLGLCVVAEVNSTIEMMELTL